MAPGSGAARTGGKVSKYAIDVLIISIFGLEWSLCGGVFASNGLLVWGG